MLIKTDRLLYGTPVDFEKARRKDFSDLARYFDEWSEFDVIPPGQESIRIGMRTMDAMFSLGNPPQEPVEGYDRSMVWTPGTDNEIICGG